MKLRDAIGCDLQGPDVLYTGGQADLFPEIG